VARGVFSGLIWGGVVAVAGAGGLSLAYPDFKPGGVEMAEPVDAARNIETPEIGSVEAVAEEPSMSEEVVAAGGVSEEMAKVEETEVEAAPEAVEPEAMPDMAIETADEMPEAADKTPEIETIEKETDKEPDSEDVSQEPETAVIVDTDLSTDSPEMAAKPEVEDAESAEQETVEAETESADPIAPAPDTDESTEPDAAATELSQEPQTITDEIIAALPKPEGTVGNLAPAITTGRLPSLGQDDEETADGDAVSAEAVPPIERFAVPVEVKSDKPLMAIVLIDAGDGALGVEALESFPYPLTFAVDANGVDAPARMQTYREKGFEVLALVDLPRGSNSSDVEVAMSAYLAAVPEAVGILEGVTSGVQSSREMADQLTQIILDSGHGMLLQASGLNTARKLAAREGIPAATVFRDFDGNGQSASVMRRFLDQAAFRAGQEGGVVMMGRLQAETISALLIWGLADRASRVSLVPVSAVLLQENAQE
jgi:polysaccharide deacetylase 2 family uncharacterized protein YibQ